MSVGPGELLAEVLRDFRRTAVFTGIDVPSPALQLALKSVRRDRFVDPAAAELAWENRPLAIGCGQTISQPYIVALMTELAAVGPGDKVLEIGTGSGYQAAILAELGAEVFTVERQAELAATAAARFRELGYERIQVHHGDGVDGWAEHAPYDAILVTAAATAVPRVLFEQLAVGGRMVVPVGTTPESQRLLVVRRDEAGRKHTRDTLPVRFAPFVGG